MSRIHSQYLIKLCQFIKKKFKTRNNSLNLLIFRVFTCDPKNKKISRLCLQKNSLLFIIHGRHTLTCIESALIISPPNRCASSIDNFVFPVPVEPKITTNGTFRNIFHGKFMVLKPLRKNRMKSTHALFVY